MLIFSHLFTFVRKDVLIFSDYGNNTYDRLFHMFGRYKSVKVFMPDFKHMGANL